MKRIFAVLICAVLFLCGCSGKAKDNRTLPKTFNASAIVEFDGMTYEALLTRISDGYWRVELLQPDAVRGLVFDIAGEEMNISFKGLLFTFDSEKFPVSSVVSLITKSFDRLVPINLDVVVGDETDNASGEVDDIAYSIIFDKNGTPLTMEFANCQMKITFESFDEIETDPDVSVEESAE